MTPGTLYLLDTNILVHAVRSDAVWDRLRETHNLLAVEPTPLISVVTVGELRSLAYQRDWSVAKREQMAFLLGYFKKVTIDDPTIYETYAVIDANLRRMGRKLGKNDLWIAATTNVFAATLITTDSDFDPIQPTFIRRERIAALIPNASG